MRYSLQAFKPEKLTYFLYFGGNVFHCTYNVEEHVPYHVKNQHYDTCKFKGNSWNSKKLV